jgi:anti-sigma-K factor RskA
MTDEDDILAAEFALGLLDDADAQGVQSRARTDSVLSLRIAWWRDQLAPLVNEAATPAPDHVWSRISAAIFAAVPANDNPDTSRPWKWATGGMGLIAAGLLAVIATRQPAPLPLPLPSAPSAPMVAALSSETGSIVAASYDATSGNLVIAPATLDPGKGDAELWIIPDGGKPISLGIVDPKVAQTRSIDAGLRRQIRPGATFAISQEAKGGSPDGSPHGPIVASGKIIRA